MSEHKNTPSLPPSINVVNPSKSEPVANANANENHGIQAVLNIEQPGVEAGFQPDASKTEEDNKATKSDDNKGQIETASKTPPIDTPINGTPSSAWQEAFRNFGYMFGRLQTYLERSGSPLGKWMRADFKSLFSNKVPKDSPKGAATMTDRAGAYVIDSPQLKVVTQQFDRIAGEFLDLSQVAAGATKKDHGTTALPSVVPPAAAPTFAPQFQNHKSNIIPPVNDTVVPATLPAPIKPSNSPHHTPT